jgi:hypothetical protein
VRIDTPIARIPNLAIHLSTSRDSFSTNIQEEAKAILSMTPELVGRKPASDAEIEVGSRLHPVLLEMCARAAGINPALIEDMELQLTDVQPSTTGGADDELIFSGRLDNLCSAYQCAMAVIDNTGPEPAKLADLETINMLLAFDHEECGSASAQGAGSSLFLDTINIVIEKLSPSGAAPSSGLLLQTMRNSFLCSVDMAHALHRVGDEIAVWTGIAEARTCPCDIGVQPKAWRGGPAVAPFHPLALAGSTGFGGTRVAHVDQLGVKTQTPQGDARLQRVTHLAAQADFVAARSRQA